MVRRKARKTLPGNGDKVPEMRSPTASGLRPYPRGAVPSKKRTSKSILEQKQIPWGSIVSVAVIVIFAVGVIGYAVTRPSSADRNSAAYLNELASAKQISGISFRKEPARNHVTGVVKYDTAPPVGGDHATIAADCSGTVYPNPIANANAMHSLEHGAVWITYQPGLPQDEVDTLASLVDGQDYLFMSPFPSQQSKISLQSWGYQLAVSSPTDERITRFIATLRNNPKTTPEFGASCANPAFKANPSTPGKPS